MRGKKLLAYGTTLALSVAAIAPTGSVLAANNYRIKDEAALASCLSAIANNNCRLDENITITNNLVVPKGANTTLNLNGKQITVGTFVGKANYGMITVENGGTLAVTSRDYRSRTTAGSITTGDSSVYAAIRMTSAENYDSTKTAELTVEDGVSLIGHYYAVVGNGDRHNTKITINGGLIKGTNDDDDSNLGIYHPQDGELIINGGAVEGNTGIEMRAGKLTVNGGTIRGLKTPFDVTPNGNGSTTDGAGIAIAQHTTLKDINVAINGGNIEGFSALYESNPQNNANVKEQVAITINDGTFKTINDGTLAVYSADSTAADSKVLTINGGKFSSKPANFTVKDGFGIALNGDMYEVKELVDLTALDGAISTAEEKEETSWSWTEWRNVPNYTAASWNNLQTALTAAKTARTEATGGFKDAMQTYVNEKTSALNTAIEGLEGLADKTALQNALKNTWLISLVNLSYSEGSFQNLLNARAAGQALIDAEVGATRQQEIADAVTAIEKAVNDRVDISNLRTAINQANRIANNREGKVTLDSFAAYHNAIEAAEAVRDDATLIGAEGKQAVANAIAKINEAHDALENLADLSDLEDLFYYVTDRVNEDEDFVMGTTLEGLYDQASQKLASAPNIGKTQQESIDALTEALETAFLTQSDNLESKKEAEEAIAEADELNADDYTAASMQAVTEAEEKLEAYEFPEDLSAADIQPEVDPLIVALNKAMENLVEAADTTALEAIIEEAKAIDETLYTEESVENLKEVLEAAALILESDDLGIDKQETVVDPAVEAIKTAIADLVKKPEAPETGILTADNNSAARSLTSTIVTIASGIVITLGAILAKIFKSRKNR